MYSDTGFAYELRSLKSEIERSGSRLRDKARAAETKKREIASLLRDMESGVAAVSRAVEEKCKELQRNSGKSSGYSSYGSSYSDGRIRDAERRIGNTIDRLGRDVDELSRAYDEVVSLSDTITKSAAKIILIGDRLVDQTKRVSSEADAAERKASQKSTEAIAAKRKAEQMSVEVDAAKRKAARDVAMAGAAAAAAIAAAAESERRGSEAKNEVSSLKRAKRSAESKIERLNEEISRLQDLVDESVSQKSDTELSDDEFQDNESIAQGYSEIWNKVLDDGIVELSEVLQLYAWLGEHTSESAEWENLRAHCVKVYRSGTVTDSDSRLLYVLSLDYLKSLGAKIE